MCGFKIQNMTLKLIFTWWHKQTLGTFFKTLLTGKLVGKDNFGNKYYKNKNDERWVVYSNEIDATKITSEWYLWMHHTTNNVPTPQKDIKKYAWQKDHKENKTGTNERYKPIKIVKDKVNKKYKSRNNN